MLTTLLGIFAFLFYLIYDINSYKWKRRFPRLFFTIGSLLLLLATTVDIIKAAQAQAFHGIVDIVSLCFSVLSFGLLIYCLFFALPFKETYAEQQSNTVCSSGVYGLCRHPGILCFFGTYLFLSIATLPHQLWINGLLFSLLNLGYACFQDLITFPKTFSDYESYQKVVPFLIPTKSSIKRARRTLTKEDNA